MMIRLQPSAVLCDLEASVSESKEVTLRMESVEVTLTMLSRRVWLPNDHPRDYLMKNSMNTSDPDTTPKRKA